jgi:AraC family transcriptional regulator
MQPKIISKPAFTVVGMKYRGKNQHNEISQLWRKFGPHMHEVRNVRAADLAYGVMDNYDENKGDFDYVAALEVENATEVSEGMTALIVPAQTYAVFPCTLNTIRQTYDTIYQSWMPASGYQRATGPEFELYDEHFDPNDSSSGMFVYIPIERH